MKATRKTIPTLIEKREEFTNTSGTVQGIPNPTEVELELCKSCQLNETELSRFRIDKDTVGLAYVVFSYDTPIAWETRKGHVYKVEQTLTQTTSKHQGLLYLFHAKER